MRILQLYSWIEKIQMKIKQTGIKRNTGKNTNHKNNTENTQKHAIHDTQSVKT